MKVVLVGAGNTGTVLGNLIKNAGHQLVEVISRSQKSALNLADKLGTTYGTPKDRQCAEADIYIICLADYFMNNMENLMALNHKFIVHTTGSLPVDRLKVFSNSYGVLFPLQSLSKYEKQIPEIT